MNLTILIRPKLFKVSWKYKSSNVSGDIQSLVKDDSKYSKAIEDRIK